MNVVYYYKSLSYPINTVINKIAEHYISEGYEPICAETQYINNKEEYYLYDCELLIYNKEEDWYKLFTLAEIMSPINNLFIDRNCERDLIVNCQTAMSVYPDDIKFNVIPGIYTPTWNDVDYEYYYNKRMSKAEYIDKFIFRGNVDDCVRRSINGLLGNKWFYGGGHIGKQDYFHELTEYKMGLCVPCVQEMTHRDVEYMGVGIPFMKFEYLNKLTPSLIPNYHYISIDRIDKEKEEERLGGDMYIEKYIEKWLEVKDNIDFLSFISKNARVYYEKYLKEDSVVSHCLSLLNDKH